MEECFALPKYYRKETPPWTFVVISSDHREPRNLHITKP